MSKWRRWPTSGAKVGVVHIVFEGKRARMGDRLVDTAARFGRRGDIKRRRCAVKVSRLQHSTMNVAPMVAWGPMVEGVGGRR